MFILSTKGCISLGVRGRDLTQLLEATNGVNFGRQIVASVVHCVALHAELDTADRAFGNFSANT